MAPHRSWWSPVPQAWVLCLSQWKINPHHKWGYRWELFLLIRPGVKLKALPKFLAHPLCWQNPSCRWDFAFSAGGCDLRLSKRIFPPGLPRSASPRLLELQRGRALWDPHGIAAARLLQQCHAVAAASSGSCGRDRQSSAALPQPSSFPGSQHQLSLPLGCPSCHSMAFGWSSARMTVVQMLQLTPSQSETKQFPNYNPL